MRISSLLEAENPFRFSVGATEYSRLVLESDGTRGIACGKRSKNRLDYNVGRRHVSEKLCSVRVKMHRSASGSRDNGRKYGYLNSFGEFAHKFSRELDFTTTTVVVGWGG